MNVLVRRISRTGKSTLEMMAPNNNIAIKLENAVKKSLVLILIFFVISSQKPIVNVGIEHKSKNNSKPSKISSNKYSIRMDAVIPIKTARPPMRGTIAM